MKATNERRIEGFKGQIPDIDTYERYKKGEIDWKDHVRKKLKAVEIPYDLFLRLTDLDKSMEEKHEPS